MTEVKGSVNDVCAANVVYAISLTQLKNGVDIHVTAVKNRYSTAQIKTTLRLHDKDGVIYRVAL